MVQLFDMYTGGRGTISLQYYNNNDNIKKKPNSQMKELPICDGNETIYWRTRVRTMTAEIKPNTLILNIEEMWNTSDSICILKSTFFLVIICALF